MNGSGALETFQNMIERRESRAKELRTQLEEVDSEVKSKLIHYPKSSALDGGDLPP